MSVDCFGEKLLCAGECKRQWQVKKREERDTIIPMPFYKSIEGEYPR
jgi:hypothetical protein